MQKIKKPTNKLLQLQILKLGYKKKLHNFGGDLKQIEKNLYKIFNIIYKFHSADKKILFLGFPTDFRKALKNTKHVLIPKFAWFDGILSNRNLFINHPPKNISRNIFKLILKLEKKLDLIVISNLNESSNAIKESYVARITTVILNFKITNDSAGSCNFINEKLEENSFFFSLVRSVLNRNEKKKIKNIKILII